MQFAFKQQSQIEHQVRSIAQGQIEKALGDCADGELDFGEVVHSVRRRTKKLRGLVRLIEPHFKPSKQENAAFRDAAAALSATRDAQVMIETFADLKKFDAKKDADGRIDASQAGQLAALLEEQVGRPPTKGEQQEMLAQFAASFTKAQERVRDWSLSGRGFDQIGDGLETTYRRMRDAMAEAEDAGTAEALHEWRKHTKYHWHHVTLLERSATDVLKPREASLDKLGELLGDHHNLAVLADTFKAQGENAIGSVIAEKQDDLAMAAFTLGRQLTAEKPALLVDRFERYWALLPEKA